MVRENYYIYHRVETYSAFFWLQWTFEMPTFFFFSFFFCNGRNYYYIYHRVETYSAFFWLQWTFEMPTFFFFHFSFATAETSDKLRWFTLIFLSCYHHLYGALFIFSYSASYCESHFPFSLFCFSKLARVAK
jgi:hypothetical protein